MISAKYGLSGPINGIKSTGEVPQRTSSHLATTIFRASQPHDGKIRCLADRNADFFLPSHIYFFCGRRGGLMVSVLYSGASGTGSSPGRGHCVVFLGKTLYSHGASLHPGVKMGTGKLNAGG